MLKPIRIIVKPASAVGSIDRILEDAKDTLIGEPTTADIYYTYTDGKLLARIFDGRTAKYSPPFEVDITVRQV